MSTKKLQILNSIIKQAENANTLGGKTAARFAATADVENLKTLVGDTPVSEQISDAVKEANDYANTAASGAAKTYTSNLKNELLNGAGEAYDTLKELADLIDDNKDTIDALEKIASSKANASDLTAHTGNTSNPHGVKLSQLGVTATASELNYMDGATSNIQAQLNSKTAVQIITWGADD